MIEIQFPLAVLLEFMADIIEQITPDMIDDCLVTVQPIPGVGVELGLKRCICDD